LAANSWLPGTFLATLALNNSEETEKGASLLVCRKRAYIEADRGTKETILSSPGAVGSIVGTHFTVSQSLFLSLFDSLILLFAVS
jgi:hypothetical protein